MHHGQRYQLLPDGRRLSHEESTRRKNSVDLDHSQISRTHRADGTFTLRAS